MLNRTMGPASSGSRASQTRLIELFDAGDIEGAKAFAPEHGAQAPPTNGARYGVLIDEKLVIMRGTEILAEPEKNKEPSPTPGG